MDEAGVLEVHPLVVLGLGKLSLSTLLVELRETGCVGVDRNERVQYIEGDVDRFTVS